MIDGVLKDKLRHVPNFPKNGIDFIDITTVLQDANLLKFLIDELKESVNNIEFDIIVGSESRGFIIGAALAYAMGKGFVPVRKKGKLPYETISTSYDLEYGKDTLEMHSDAIKEGQRVLIVDDLLATGGTVGANIKLIQKLGGIIVGTLFMVELTYLGGRNKICDCPIISLVQFDS